ncbi:hypothetical protein P168DRAFT_52971 [Aspergillus campestris IBT 28561]|uniref:Uncharacterized protein n=1 Tax=Aspergillus campestris (strain IBT 28561) TaxID=1392248 RepID=A0A2I1CVG1_ASPC2|nr:uncharacterized protein P168DRAFT_52971 [Aspergillus campestris IBT 28561]PKY01609.1 hypothetical protein P168DRAFT_52971 [Aspergillus campestris IBT 28561]
MIKSSCLIGDRSVASERLSKLPNQPYPGRLWQVDYGSGEKDTKGRETSSRARVTNTEQRAKQRTESTQQTEWREEEEEKRRGPRSALTSRSDGDSFCDCMGNKYSTGVLYPANQDCPYG